MNKLEQLIKETDYTQEEWNIHKKVERHNQLEDLKYLLDLMLENNNITQEQYETVCENAEAIVEKYNKYDDYDWQITMKDAINYVLEDKNDITI